MGLRKKSDASLVSEIQNGNEYAFNELYDRYHKLVYYVAFQLTKCEADAEEVKQEVFLKVLNHIHDVKDAKRFKYWLTTITHNECKHLFRSNKSSVMNEEELDVLYNQSESRKDFLPEEHVHYTSDMKVLRDCLLKLNKEHREVITLKYFAQLSIDEIADILQIPNGTVKSRLANAKKLLKTDVETYCREHDVALTFHMGNLGAVCALLMYGKRDAKTLTMRDRMQMFWITASFFTKMMVCSSMVLCGIITAYVLSYAISGNDVQPYSYTDQTTNFDAKATYAKLKHFAHCEVELATKSEVEKASMRPLYERLKKEGNYYYILLEQYWKGAFE